VFTARYALSPYIKQIRFLCKGLILVHTVHENELVSTLSESVFASYLSKARGSNDPEMSQTQPLRQPISSVPQRNGFPV
jgi:hypothetical protein